jgi:hypothetical protein
VKVTASTQCWRTHDIKTRAYGSESKAALVPWIISTYSADSMTELPPVTVDRVRLKLDPALNAASRLLQESHADEVLLPLGLPQEVVKAYSALKLSAFLTQHPKQLRTLERQVQRVHAETGCGLDLLALRRAYGPSDGSLSQVASRIYAYVNSGGRDLTKALNLRSDHLSHRTAGMIDFRRQTTHEYRRSAVINLQSQMQTVSPEMPTGIMIRR